MLLVEAAHWLPWRLPLTDNHFIRIADATSVTMVISGVAFFAIKLSDGLFYLVQWLPVIIVFLLCAQLYSERQSTPFKAIVATLRKRPATADGSDAESVDLRLPYFFLTLVAASIAAPMTPAFYLISGFLIIWALWNVRPSRYHPAFWFSFVSAALAMGFVFHIGLSQLQGVVQEITSHWLENDWSNRDLNHSSTAFGKIGRLKLSEEIIMRIHSSVAGTQASGLLLQQAEYNRYAGSTWFADNREFQPLPKPSSGNTWFLSGERPLQAGHLSVATYLSRGEGILALPRGSYAINSAAGRFSRYAYGAFSVEDAPKLLNYEVYYQRNQTNASPVRPHDQEVPAAYTQLMTNIVTELGLATLPPEKAALKLKQFFEHNFTYSLFQDDTDLLQSPLHYFLLQGRHGHCEYFATASVLLLRAAGIPARYVNGFAMTEYDTAKDLFIVRKRHAHAWTLAYLNGRWTELDYTPSTWAAMEADAAPWWQSIYDTVSNLIFALNQWWLAKPRSLWKYVLIPFGIFAVIYLFTKFKPGSLRFRFTRKIPSNPNSNDYPGKDSPFYTIINHLEKTLAPRHAGEPLKHWLQRLSQTSDLDLNALNALVEQHYSYRFSAQSQESFDKEIFTRQVTEWLATEK